MTIRIEELDFRNTPLGELILRRRLVPSMNDVEVLEVKLDDAFLMSSVVNVSEIALADLALDQLDWGDVDVVVGGLGLGYTAVAALDHHAVQSVVVVEYLNEVIDWHRRGLVAPAARLKTDPRCQFVNGDFFGLLNPALGFDPANPGRRFHAILVDIDHSPQALLHPSHAKLYTTEGLTTLTQQLHPGGIFGLWSADPPDKPFVETLRTVFAEARAEEVEFFNPVMDCHDTNTIYIARLG
jgi:spermidine synthase